MKAIPTFLLAGALLLVVVAPPGDARSVGRWSRQAEDDTETSDTTGDASTDEASDDETSGESNDAASEQDGDASPDPTAEGEPSAVATGTVIDWRARAALGFPRRPRKKTGSLTYLTVSVRLTCVVFIG